jgi:hypothetical protein
MAKDKFTLTVDGEELPYSADNLDYLKNTGLSYGVNINGRPAKEVMDEAIISEKDEADKDVSNEIKSTLVDIALTLIPGTTAIKLSKMSTPALRMLIAGVSDAAIDIGRTSS